MSQNWITVWLDLTYGNSATTVDSAATHLALCKIDPYLVTFRKSDRCINYITGLQANHNKVIVLISNDTPVDTLLQQSEELSQIGSVYIVLSNETSDTEIFKISAKIRGIYTDLESLCNQLGKHSHKTVGKKRRGSVKPYSAVQRSRRPY
jgi:hypothetical protein